MKITVSVCKLTELRSACRRAYTNGTVEEVEDALDELLFYARDRYNNGDWTESERTWFDTHPRFVAYCELSDEERTSWTYEDLWM
jgi:hypothetical protein